MPDLEDLYREIILDHYRSPRNRGELPSPPAQRSEGFNPLCGDEVVVTIQVDDGKLTDIKIGGTGCSISQSSASLMSGAVKGKSLEEVQQIIGTFKSLMSVHGAALQADDQVREDTSDLTDPTLNSEDQPVDLNALGELAALQGVVKFPVRIKCATLSWNTLSEALKELENSRS